MAIDPFVRASRRIIRRRGKIVLLDKGEVQVEILGVFTNPEGDLLTRSKSGGLVFKQRQPTLLVLTEQVQGLSKDWQITVAGMEYFAADHKDDDAGCTKIFLSKAVEELEESDNGSKWR